jgi:hypothetical protein
MSDWGDWYDPGVNQEGPGPSLSGTAGASQGTPQAPWETGQKDNAPLSTPPGVSVPGSIAGFGAANVGVVAPPISEARTKDDSWPATIQSITDTINKALNAQPDAFNASVPQQNQRAGVTSPASPIYSPPGVTVPRYVYPTGVVLPGGKVGAGLGAPMYTPPDQSQGSPYSDPNNERWALGSPYTAMINQLMQPGVHVNYGSKPVFVDPNEATRQKPITWVVPPVVNPPAGGYDSAGRVVAPPSTTDARALPPGNPYVGVTGGGTQAEAAQYQQQRWIDAAKGNTDVASKAIQKAAQDYLGTHSHYPSISEYAQMTNDQIKKVVDSFLVGANTGGDAGSGGLSPVQAYIRGLISEDEAVKLWNAQGGLGGKTGFEIEKDRILHQGNTRTGGGGGGGSSSSTGTSGVVAPPETVPPVTPVPTVSEPRLDPFTWGSDTLTYGENDLGTLPERYRSLIDPMMRALGFVPQGQVGLYGEKEYKLAPGATRTSVTDDLINTLAGTDTTAAAWLKWFAGKKALYATSPYPSATGVVAPAAT